MLCNKVKKKISPSLPQNPKCNSSYFDEISFSLKNKKISISIFSNDCSLCLLLSGTHKSVMLCKRLQTMRDIHDQFSCEDKCSLIYLLVVFPSQFVNIYKLIKLKCNDTRTKIRRIFLLTFCIRKFSKCPNKKYFTHLSLFLCNRWNGLTKTWYSPKNYFSGISKTSVSPFYETSTWVITR